jgi:hypothetical protein
MAFQAPNRPELGPVGHDLDQDHARAQRPGEESPRDRQITPRRQQNIDDLAMLSAIAAAMQVSVARRGVRAGAGKLR